MPYGWDPNNEDILAATTPSLLKPYRKDQGASSEIYGRPVAAAKRENTLTPLIVHTHKLLWIPAFVSVPD